MKLGVAGLLCLPIAVCASPPHIERVNVNTSLRFEPNVDQADPGVSYVARGAGYSMLLSGTAAYLTVQAGFIQMKLEGAAKPTTSHPEAKLPSVTNYYLGDDPKQWHERVPKLRARAI